MPHSEEYAPTSGTPELEKQIYVLKLLRGELTLMVLK